MPPSPERGAPGITSYFARPRNLTTSCGTARRSALSLENSGRSPCIYRIQYRARTCSPYPPMPRTWGDPSIPRANLCASHSGSRKQPRVRCAVRGSAGSAVRDLAYRASPSAILQAQQVGFGCSRQPLRTRFSESPGATLRFSSSAAVRAGPCGSVRVRAGPCGSVRVRAVRAGPCGSVRVRAVERSLHRYHL